MKGKVHMSGITITEALAEIKTIKKRIESKRQFIADYSARQSIIRDPLEKDGGSETKIKAELQAISDLESRWVKIRSLIQESNLKTTIEVCGKSNTVTAWLNYRKEVAAGRQLFFTQMRSQLTELRRAASKKGMTEEKTGDQNHLVINIDESELAKESDLLNQILGDLDGQLSLKNATVTINVL